MSQYPSLIRAILMRKKCFWGLFMLLLMASVTSCQRSDIHEYPPPSANTQSNNNIQLNLEATVDGFELSHLSDLSSDTTLRTLPIARQNGRMYYPFVEGDEVKVTFIIAHKPGMYRKTTIRDVPFVYTGGKLRARQELSLPTVRNIESFQTYWISGYINCSVNEDVGSNTDHSAYSSAYVANRMRWAEPNKNGIYTVTPRQDALREQLYAPYFLDWMTFDMTAIRKAGSNPTPLQNLKFKPNGVILRLSFENISDKPFTIKRFTIKSPGLSKIVDAVTQFTRNNPNIRWQKPGNQDAEQYTFELLTPLTLRQQRSKETYWVWLAAYGNSLATGNYQTEITIQGEGEPNTKTEYRVTTTLRGPSGNRTHGTIPVAIRFAAQGSPTSNPTPTPPNTYDDERVFLPLEFLTESSLDFSNKQFYGDAAFFNQNENSLIPPYNLANNGLLEFSKGSDRFFLPDYLDWVTVVPTSISRNSMETFGDVNGFWTVGPRFFARRSSDNGMFRRMEHVRLRDKRSGQIISEEKSLGAVYNLRSEAEFKQIVYAIRLEGGDNRYRSAWRYEYTPGKGLEIRAIRLSGELRTARIETISDEQWWYRQEHAPVVSTRISPLIKRYLAVGGNIETRERDGRYISQPKEDKSLYLQFSDERIWIQEARQVQDRRAKASIRFFKHDPEGTDTRHLTY